MVDIVSGTYYYVYIQLAFRRKIHTKLNEADVCLLRVKFKSGFVIMAVAVDVFLATASTMAAIVKLYSLLKKKYKVNQLGLPKRYLGWHFHYKKRGQ